MVGCVQVTHQLECVCMLNLFYLPKLSRMNHGRKPFNRNVGNGQINHMEEHNLSNFSLSLRKLFAENIKFTGEIRSLKAA